MPVNSSFSMNVVRPPSSGSSSSSSNMKRPSGDTMVPALMRAIWARRKLASVPGNGGKLLTGAFRRPVKNLRILRDTTICAGVTPGSRTHPFPAAHSSVHVHSIEPLTRIAIIMHNFTNYYCSL